MFLHSEAFLVDPYGGHSYFPQQALVCQYGGIRADDEEGTPRWWLRPGEGRRGLRDCILIRLSCEAEKLSRPVERREASVGAWSSGLLPVMKLTVSIDRTQDPKRIRVRSQLSV